MKRNIYINLLEWKNKEDKKPLLIRGKRQVGKTYIVQKFAQNEYSNYVYINFLSHPKINSIFNDGLDPEKVINNISLLKNKEIKDNTLIIFDEIQESMKALNFLKFFNESNLNKNLIATGSWIEAALHKHKGNFPVGQVELLTMHPLTIDEFTWAFEGNKNMLHEIDKCFNKKISINKTLHNKMLNIYYEYISIGGMPEIVDFYIKNKKAMSIIDLDKAINEKLYNLRNGYLNDLSKYSTNINLIKINQVYDSLANILSQDFNKFKYQLVDRGKKTQARDWSTSIDLLNLNRLTVPTYHIKKITSVIEGNYEHKNFKLYYSDVGFLVNKSNISRQKIIEESFSYKGWVTENFVAVHLNVYYEKLFYWYYQPFELDFIIQNEDRVIPIDVKSGRSKRSTSMKKYIEKNKPQIALTISKDNFDFKNNFINIPVYAIYLIKNL